MDIQSLIDHPSKLPTVPRVAQRVIASFGSEDVTIGEISDLISADLGLSAKLLRLANSAYFQMARSVETVDDAIRILGMAMVRNLVLGVGMVETFAQAPGLDLHQFWKHNLYTACAAKWMAAHCNVNRDLAFTLGLLQGIGQLHMHMAAPSAMVALDQQAHVLAPQRTSLEFLALGFNAFDVSAALAAHWNFPPTLVEPLSKIADPLAATEFSAPAGLVHLGIWRSRNEILAMPQEEVAQTYPDAVANHLGLASVLPGMPAPHDLAHGLDAMLA
jgi:HD-like signal output (HDOD) protein